MEQLGQFQEGLFTAFEIIHAEGEEATAGGRVAGEGEHGHATAHGAVDGVVELFGVGAGQDDAIHAAEDQLFQVIRLFLTVLFIGGAPIDFDGEAVLHAEFTGGGVGAGPGGLEELVALGLGDHAEGVAFLPLHGGGRGGSDQQRQQAGHEHAPSGQAAGQ